MEQYSIVEVQQLRVQNRPIYAKKNIPIYNTVYAYPEPVIKNNKIIHAQGYLGIVIGFTTENGVIYLRVDDTNRYNNKNIAIYVEANKDSITINEADSPPPKFTFFDTIGDIISSGTSSVGNGIKKVAITGIAIIAITLLVKSLVVSKSKKTLIENQ